MKTALRLALRLYPHWWRKRYGDEMDALIEDSGARWPAVFDVVRSALVVRIGDSMKGTSLSEWIGRNALGLAFFLILGFAFIQGGAWILPGSRAPMVGRFMACLLGAVFCYALRASLVMACLTWLAGFYGSWLIFTPVFGSAALYEGGIGLHERPNEPVRVAVSICAATLVWLVMARARARRLRVA